jgi:hypothetical protein
MAKHRDPNAHATAYDVERVTATMAELSFDLERSVRAAVPIALAEALGAEIDPARLERVAQIIFAEIAMRYSRRRRRYAAHVSRPQLALDPRRQRPHARAFWARPRAENAKAPRLDPERALDVLDLGFGRAQGRFEE